MVDIQLYTVKNTLNILNKIDITSHSVNSFNVNIDFDDSWNEYPDKRVVFYTNFDDKIYTMYLTQGTTCKIPTETLVETGKLYIGVVGAKFDGTKLASTVLEFTIKLGAMDGDESEIILTPSVVDVLMGEIKRVENLIGDKADEEPFNILQEKVENLTTTVNTKADTKTYNPTISTNWTSENEYFKQDIAVNGLLATDNPIIDLIVSLSDYVTEENQWTKIFKVVTNNNKITVYAKEETTKAITVQIKVVR